MTGVDTRSPASDPVAAENLAELTRDPRFRLVAADVAAADLAVLLEGVQVVFHLAALPGVRRSWGDRFADYLTCNVLGYPAAAGGVRGCARYRGWCSRPRPASTARRQGSPRGRPIRRSRCRRTGCPSWRPSGCAWRTRPGRARRPRVVALRYFTVYGPRQRPDMAFSRIMRAALSGRAVPLYGTGAQRRDFTYVSDAVDRDDRRSDRRGAGRGGQRGLRHAACRSSDVLAAIARLAGAEVPVLRRVAQPGDVDATAADLTRARDLLGYEPQVDLAEGLRRQWEWLAAREHPVASGHGGGGAVTLT